jgi:hypothetical protein
LDKLPPRALNQLGFKWKLCANINQTKIVVISKGGIVKENTIWFYNDVQVDVVDKFTYLGVILNFNDSISQSLT